MTKIKNTKKGMAKKTLSMSLVVAMLATSNVPVWAAEFSDGTDTPISTEAPAAEAFSDDAAEAPVVEDGTVENATATTSKLAPLVMDEKVNVKSTTSSAEVWTGSLEKKQGNVLHAATPQGVKSTVSTRPDLLTLTDTDKTKLNPDDLTVNGAKTDYQWYRDAHDGKGAVAINGAKKSDYTLTKDDIGADITVKITETYQYKLTTNSLGKAEYVSCTDIYESASAYQPVAYGLDQLELTVGSSTFKNVNNDITVKFEDLIKDATLATRYVDKDGDSVTPILTSNNISVSGLDLDVDDKMQSLEYGKDFVVFFIGDPDANGNQKAKLVFNGYTWNGSDKFAFNVSDAKGTLNNTNVTITTAKDAAWDGQWGTELKANLDTNLGNVVSYQWQKCEKSDSVNADNTINWKDITGATAQNFTPDQSLVKYGTNNDGKDYLIRVKVTYKNKSNEEKTTYSTYAAVHPQSVSVNDIVLAKADGTTISTDKTITAAELNGMTVTVKSQKLTNGTQYSVTGFNVDKAGIQEVSVVLASPYTGKKIINVSNKMTDIAQAQITLGKNVYTYNPEGITPEISKVVLGDKTLVAGTDYTVDKLTPNVTAYEKQPEINGAPNGAAVSITGTGVYQGTATTSTAATKINVVPENLESKCEVKVSETTIPVETLKDSTKLAKYVKVYYKTADGRKIDLSDTNNYTIKVANKNIIPGEKVTLKVVGTAASATNFEANQNFYGTLTVDVTAEADDIFNDTTKIPGSDITRGNAFLGEIASAITGDVYMENGSTLTKVALDKTAGKGETFTGSDITFDGLKSLKHHTADIYDEGDYSWGIETLVAGHDYTVTYNNNLHAGKYNNNPAPSVTIKMIGKYKGERTFYFNIEQQTISNRTVTSEISAPIVFNALATNSTAKDVYAPADKFALAIAGKTTRLTEGKDFSIDWIRWVNNDKDDTSKGHFEITVKAHQSRNADTGDYFYDGDYTGEATYTMNITAKSLTSSDIKFADIDAQKWTGSASKPALVITDGTYTLVEGKDFKATWKDNVSVGNATVTVEGINGRYKDKLQKNFAISSKSISDGKIVNNYKPSTKNDLSGYTAADSVLKNEMYNDGKDVKATFAVVDANNNKLEEGRDYTVEYKDNKNVGTATITITGKGSYEGTLTTTFKIVGELINGKFDKKVIADQVYTGNEIKPEVKFTPSPLKLEEGKDYEIVYVNNVNSYTATGKENLDAADYAGPYVVARGIGNYAGEIRLPFNIKAAELTNACATAADAEYAGGKIAEAKITVKNPVSGKELEEGKDYKVEYKSGVNVGDKGEAVITILDTKNYTVKGNADNTLTVNYNIVAKDLKDVTVNTIEDKTYTGSQITPAVTVMNGDVVLTPDVDYTLSYGENKEVGVGTVTITAKGNNYKGTKEATFNIVEAKPEVGKAMISDVVVKGNVATPVLSGDVDGAVGYDYVIATEEDYQNGRVDISKNILKTNTNFYYVQKGTYYAYCHAWKRDENGKKVFGAWSNIYKFEVTATTPSTPKITSVKAKGNTVTVTYTASKNATGYDVVLGNSVKSVNGEKRPVDYGTLVKKNIKGNVVTVTFKNVKKGTYYAGLHSFNRTSEDGKKVFSKWSNAKKVTVK